MRINIVLSGILFLLIAAEGMGRVTMQEKLEEKINNDSKRLTIALVEVESSIINSTLSKQYLKDKIMPSCFSGEKSR